MGRMVQVRADELRGGEILVDRMSNLPPERTPTGMVMIRTYDAPMRVLRPEQMLWKLVEDES